MRARLIAAALAALPVTLAAQQQARRAVGGVEFYSVKLGSSQTISEFVVPIGVVVPIGPRFSLDAGTYAVSASSKLGGNTTTISGVTDLLVRAGYQIVPDVVVATVALNLPTGQSTLDTAQLALTGNTATDLIPFPVTSFGTGFNATTGLAVAVPVGGWALGAAGSFRVNGTYTPLAGSAQTFKPGNEYRLRVGADRVVGQGRLSFGVTFSTFSHDELGGDHLAPGKRLITQAAWNVPIARRMVSLYAWDVLRNADSTVIVIDTTTNATQTIPPAHENTFAIGATTGIRTGRHTLRPMVEYRYARRGTTSYDPYGSLFSFGAREIISASQRWTVTPGLRLDVGSVTGVGSITGVSASVTVRASL